MINHGLLDYLLFAFAAVQTYSHSTFAFGNGRLCHGDVPKERRYADGRNGDVRIGMMGDGRRPGCEKVRK